MPPLSITWLIAITLLFSARPHAVAVSCAAVIGNATIADVNAFNNSVANGVFGLHPYGAECFSSFSGNLFPISADATKCAAAQKGWTLGTGPSSQPGGMVNSNFQTCQRTNKQCILSFEDPSDARAFKGQTCDQGSTSQAYLDVQVANDVVLAFKFAKSHNVPLLVHNTGHDFLGRSTQPGSLALYTHNLKNISYSDAFKPAGDTATYQAVVVGAGVQFRDVYAFVRARGLEVVGGTSNSVGMSGGWVAGGGHGFLAPAKGLGVDNLLQVKVVVPNGGLITASRKWNADVFFAVAGGGPSSIGVVMETVFKAYPTKQVTFVSAGFATQSAADVKAFLSAIVPISKDLISKKYGGGISLTPIVGQGMGIVMINEERNVTEATSDFKAVSDYLSSLPASSGASFGITTFPSYQDALDAILGSAGEAAPFGQELLTGSRLIPDSLWDSTANINKVVEALNSYVLALQPKGADDPIPGALVQLGLAAPYSTPSSGTTSETPAWRTAVFHALGQVAWAWNSTTAYKDERGDALNTGLQYLRDLAPNSGAYISESFVGEPNFAATFWGTSNYNKLLSIKAKYDPDSLLQCFKCVGYDPDSSRYDCYSKSFL